MEFNKYDTEEVSFNHYIDQNPKQEDKGRIKVYASILPHKPLDLRINGCKTVLDFSLSTKEFLDNVVWYKWDQMNCLETYGSCLNPNQVSCATRELHRYVCNVVMFSAKYSQDCALSMYVTLKYSPSPPPDVDLWSKTEDEFAYFGT
ncbi:unnamed protein product [Cochlearia groenlandica]